MAGARNFPHHLKFKCFSTLFLSFHPFVTIDSSLYAHYVFKAFDVNCNGAISFRDHIVTLSTLLRGSVYERLKWTFKLYDLNGDGCISRGELAEVVQAVHELMGKRIPEDDKKTRDQVSQPHESLRVVLIGRFPPRSRLIECSRSSISTRTASSPSRSSSRPASKTT
jgi:Kv channel-interacting protein